MGHDCTWYIPSKVILANVYGSVDQQELITLDHTLTRLLQDDAHYSGTHVIIDIKHAENLPGLRAYRDIKWYQHPQVEWTVMCNIRKPFIRFMVYTVAQMLSAEARSYVADSREGALAFLADVDMHVAREMMHSRDT
ncbi:MAG: hypothetical protein ACLFTK_06565 [Anaerolineales bacterium]